MPRCSAYAYVAAGEESVLAIEGNRPDRSFDGIGVDFDAAVVEEADQPLPVAQPIANVFRNRRASGHTSTLRLEPGLEAFYEGFCASLALRAPLLS